MHQKELNLFNNYLTNRLWLSHFEIKPEAIYNFFELILYITQNVL